MCEIVVYIGKTTMTPLEVMLAKKTIHAKQRRKDSQEMATHIATQKRNHARAVHMRKEAIQMIERHTEEKNGGATMMRNSSSSTSLGRGTGEFLVGDYEHIRQQVLKYNESSKMAGGRSTRLGTPASSTNLMGMRRESERGVLTLAYKIRAQANGEGSSGRQFVGMNTSRKIAKDDMRETIRELKMRKAMARPKTAGSFGSRGGSSPSTTGQRPSSAAGWGGAGSRNQWDTMKRTTERPKTAGVLTRNSEVKDLVNEYNMERMMSTLTINSESIGAGGIRVKAVKIADRSLPVEEQTQVGDFETTHLHKVRLR